MAAADILSIPAEIKDQIVEKTKKDIPAKEVEYIPEEKKPSCEAEKRLKLKQGLAELIAEKSKAALNEHINEEKYFLSHFVAEEIKNG